jgi:hypothetical protein
MSSCAARSYAATAGVVASAIVMPTTSAASVWMEIDLARAGAEVHVSARGSRGEAPRPHRLGADFGPEHLDRFAAAVRGAAERCRPLGPDLVARAQALCRAILKDQVGELWARLVEAADGPLLLRLTGSDPELQRIPWEALATPGEAMGFWATSPNLSPIRSVATTDPWQPREVRGAVRVLAVSPAGSAAPLRDALHDRIASNEVEWLDPIEGAAARLPWLFERLRCEPIPHALHFIGHGGLRDGVASLRLADRDGDEVWLPVELLAQQIKASFRGHLRLIVLEACEGARPSPFASAAEILARAGADAVVAHLWPVRADVARVCSQQLYRSLAGADQGHADVARSLNEARRALLATFEGSAEAFSPVLYVRGRATVLFDFKGRKRDPPPSRRPIRAGAGAIDPALATLLAGPFSLLIGDHCHDERSALDGLRDRLDKALAKLPTPPPPGLPLSALAQRFAFRRGSMALGKEFQKAFPGCEPRPSLLDALAARVAGPGVHATLLRSPVFEHALARHQPALPLYVLQPDEKAVAVLRPKAGGEGWEELAEPPAVSELRAAIVVLRLYRGITPDRVFTAPLLTEDDYLFGFPEIESVLPRALADALLRALHTRPALCLGLSLPAWDHRVALSRLFGRRPLPSGSLAVLDPSDPDRDLWEGGAGLPGKSGIPVVDAADDLAQRLVAFAPGGER